MVQARVIEVFWELGLFADLGNLADLEHEVHARVDSRFRDLNQKDREQVAADLMERMKRLRERRASGKNIKECLATT